MLILKILKYLLIIIAVVSLAAYLFTAFHPVFGGKPDAESAAKIQASPQFDGEKFVNAEPTQKITTEDGSFQFLGWLKTFFTPPPDKNPREPLPSEKPDFTKMQNGDFVWFGHSTVAFKTDGKLLLTDPVFYRASPVPFTAEPFAQQHPTLPADFPAIDAVILSHDHYDHLDYRTIKALDPKVRRYFVPLGVKAHLQHWGVDSGKITESDWHETSTLGNIRLTPAPARHFSGRRPGGDGATLWASWVIQSPDFSLYFNGDSGYGRHFAENGRRYGPFDFALMENGAYNKDWAQIHMTPEESVQAAADLGAKAVMPIHWAKFDLAYHKWREPIERFLPAAQAKNLPAATPKIGQVFNLGELPQEVWWVDVK
ncbi:MBL fold metallo-hydrolase [Neisseria chenwenguii]|uniref:Multidrug transporter n=1 Tax=Neisseria chenwenguii TaxID=1853278 RepID=A0A220RZV4_9NEIS|nr:MBL fold metallo-hydrolase [Neisseria chenwenguii]ASK26761.1 multidrug transporter [Neisseria chenwenguii]ROV56423.1 multidrug transporter [Neisseria chenwenguii]